MTHGTEGTELPRVAASWTLGLPPSALALVPTTRSPGASVGAGCQGGEAAGPWGWPLTLCGLPVSGEEPAAPLHRGPPPLRARLGHSQRPASRPRPSPDHPRHQRSWPWPSGPRQPGLPGAGPPGRRTPAASVPAQTSPAPRPPSPLPPLAPWLPCLPLCLAGLGSGALLGSPGVSRGSPDSHGCLRPHSSQGHKIHTAGNGLGPRMIIFLSG